MKDDDYMGLAVDGEIYKVKNGKRVNVELDPVLPKIRMLRRVRQQKNMDEIMAELMHF